MRVRVTFAVGAALVIVAAAMLSQQALYEGLVVPRLPSLRQVPVAWWLGLAAPVMLAALVSGWMARSWGETLVTAALGAVGLQTYGLWLAQAGRPGWYKSFAAEAPTEYWTSGTVQALLLLVALASIGHACRKTPDMLTRRFIVAVLSAPAAAAITFYLLWLTWLIVFVSRKPEELFADWYAAASLLRTWPVIAVAFACALIFELVVGLPLLAFFQRIGWLSFSAFLAGGCATGFAFYVATHGPELPAQRDLAATAVLLLVPGCIGALVFGYVGGWLTSRLSGPA